MYLEKYLEMYREMYLKTLLRDMAVCRFDWGFGVGVLGLERIFIVNLYSRHIW